VFYVGVTTPYELK